MKNARENASGDKKGKTDMVAEGKRKCLNEAIRERTHARRSGGSYEQFHREVSNGCLSIGREHPS